MAMCPLRPAARPRLLLGDNRWLLVIRRMVDLLCLDFPFDMVAEETLVLLKGDVSVGFLLLSRGLDLRLDLDFVHDVESTLLALEIRVAHVKVLSMLLHRRKERVNHVSDCPLFLYFFKVLFDLLLERCALLLLAHLFVVQPDVVLLP